MVVLGLLRAVADFSNQGLPLVSEGINLFVGIDNTPPYEIHLLRDGTELELAGGMPFGTTAAVAKILDATPTIEVLHLNSNGGRISEAYSLYNKIKERNLVTYTSADCVSACSIAFLAGRERYIGESGRLGFHSVSISEVGEEIFTNINDEVRQILKTHGAPSSFIARAMSTNPKDVWYPTKQELLEVKIINSVVDSRYLGLSGLSQWRDAHKIESILLDIPVYSNIAQYDQKSYMKLRDVLVVGIQKGRSQMDIQNDIRSMFQGQLIPTYLKQAPDEPLIRYWRSQITEMKHLAKLNPQHCADFAFPQFAKSAQDLQRLLPKNLQMEDVDALAAVVKGMATNPQPYGLTAEIEEDLEMVVIKVTQTYPNALEVLQSPRDYKDYPASLCSAVIAFCSEILAIPSSSRSGAVLRYIFSEQP